MIGPFLRTTDPAGMLALRDGVAPPSPESTPHEEEQP